MLEYIKTKRFKDNRSIKNTKDTNERNGLN